MSSQVLITLHVIGAAILAGGHIIASLGFLPRALRSKKPEQLLAFLKAFTPVSHGALLVQIITGIWLAMPLFGNPASAATKTVEIKILLLVLILGITIHAKVRVVKRLPDSMGIFAGHIFANGVLATALLVLGVGLRFV